MEFKNLYRTLEKNKFYVFSHAYLLAFYPGEEKSNLKTMLSRWAKKGWIYSLKRGLYELTYPKDFNISDMYVANKLYNPSYVSLETALSNYSIIPEVAMGVTSLTTKPTRKFKNKHGFFVYRTIKSTAFMGYHVEKQGDFNILIAEPEKALIDYLYFKAYRNDKFNLKDERLDMDIISRLSKKKLNKYAELYNLDLKDFYAHL